MNTFEKAGVYLGLELQRMRTSYCAPSDLPVGQPLERWMEYLAAAERETKQELDRLLRDVTPDRHFPALASAKAQYMLMQRALCGLDWIGMCLCSPEIGIRAQADATGLVRWMLVPLWERRSDQWLKLSALPQGVGPFYPSSGNQN